MHFMWVYVGPGSMTSSRLAMTSPRAARSARGMAMGLKHGGEERRPHEVNNGEEKSIGVPRRTTKGDEFMQCWREVIERRF